MLYLRNKQQLGPLQHLGHGSEVPSLCSVRSQSTKLDDAGSPNPCSMTNRFSHSLSVVDGEYRRMCSAQGKDVLV